MQHQTDLTPGIRQVSQNRIQNERPVGHGHCQQSLIVFMILNAQNRRALLFDLTGALQQRDERGCALGLQIIKRCLGKDLVATG